MFLKFLFLTLAVVAITLATCMATAVAIVTARSGTSSGTKSAPRCNAIPGSKCHTTSGNKCRSRSYAISCKILGTKSGTRPNIKFKFGHECMVCWLIA